jgi:hypothetical protein
MIDTTDATDDASAGATDRVPKFVGSTTGQIVLVVSVLVSKPVLLLGLVCESGDGAPIEDVQSTQAAP